MDEQDAKILNRLQRGLPLSATPYGDVAAELGMTGEELIRRVRRMKEEGVIRRIGAVFNPAALGYVSTLVAARVPPEGVEAFVAVVNAYPGVTHNYGRRGAYNVWFTLTCKGEDELARTLDEIRAATGVKDLISLRSREVYKIDARFEV